jgi:DNA-directed RNA polymerase beta' subunit
MNPKKKDYVDDIKENRDMVFIHSIPVFTTHLRPIDIHDGDLFFSMENGIYNMINKHAHNINKTSRKMDKNPQIKNSELYKLQMKYMELCEEILNTLSTKYGILRGLIGGRYNFSSRAVIRQDPTLRVDQIKLPYTMLVKTQQQRIINILMRSYNMNPSQAYQIYQSALSSYNEQVAQILNNIIRESGEGLPCILNRNPKHCGEYIVGLQLIMLYIEFHLIAGKSYINYIWKTSNEAFYNI